MSLTRVGKMAPRGLVAIQGAHCVSFWSVSLEFLFENAGGMDLHDMLAETDI
jgi:hypothetical protein